MYIESWILLALIPIITAIITTAFVFGMTKGMLNGLRTSLKNALIEIGALNTNFTTHLNEHCKDCPGTRNKK